MADRERLRPDTSQIDPSKPGFDTSTFLNEQGVRVIGVGAERGLLVVENDETGERKEINASDVLANAGLDPDQFNFVLNRPETALSTSPLTISERFQVIGLGNRKGQIKWLQENFEDVAETESGDLVVKQKGVWSRIDGDTFGHADPWEWTREIAADIADVVPEIVATGALGTTAALSGGTALAAAPAIGAGLEALRTSLGRIAGTYDATVDEQIADVATETILSFGGEGIALGLKPAFSAIFKSVKNIIRTVSDPTKEMLAFGMGIMNKSGVRATNELFKNPSKLQNTIEVFMNRATKNTGGTRFTQPTIDEARRLMGNQMESTFNEFSRRAGRASSKIWTDGMKKVLDLVPNDAQFSVKDTGLGLLKMLEETGFGKISQVAKTNQVRFAVNTREKILSNLQQFTGTQASKFTSQELKGIAPLIKEMEGLANAGVLQGKVGATQLMESRKTLSRMITSIGEEYPAIRATMEKIRGSMDDTISEGLTIQRTGRIADNQRVSRIDSAARAFDGLRNRWSKVTDDLKAVKQISTGDTQAASVNALMTDSPVRSREIQRVVANAIESMDKAGVGGGQKLFDRLVHLDAASKYVDWRPRFDKLQGIGAAAIAWNLGTASFVPAFLASTSPAFGRRLAQGMAGVVNLGKTLTTDQLEKVLKNDVTMRQLFQGTVRSIFESEELKNQLEEQVAGAIEGMTPQ